MNLPQLNNREKVQKKKKAATFAPFSLLVEYGNRKVEIQLYDLGHIDDDVFVCNEFHFYSFTRDYIF